MKYYMANQRENLVLRNLTQECIDCMNLCDSSSEISKCKLGKGKSRRGVSQEDSKYIFLCSELDVHIKSSRIFKETKRVYFEFIKDLGTFRLEVVDEVSKDTKRMLHNLTSLNAHNIQELYSIVPQEKLTRDIRGQIRTIKKHIAENMDETAFSFLRFVKNNAAMKTEFSVFKKLYNSGIGLQKKDHYIRKAVLNVLHIFFQDFTDKGIYVKVLDCDRRISLDYESFHVCLYHLIDNATKYTMPNTELAVSFKGKENYLCVSFEMMSFKINEAEKGKMFLEGFSGEEAKKAGLNGDGIGMALIVPLLRRNNARLEIESIGSEVSFNDLVYQSNIFNIYFDFV